MDTDQIVAGFRRKFGTPANLLRRMGFDSGEIDEMLGRNGGDRRRARDEGGEEAAETLLDLAEGCLDLDSEGREQIVEAAKEIAAAGDVDGWLERTLQEADDRGRLGEDRRRRVDARRRAADRRRYGQDLPPDLPGGGRPTPGGRLTELRAAEDRRRVRHGMDAISTAPTGKSFSEAFPTAAKLRHGFGFGR